MKKRIIKITVLIIFISTLVGFNRGTKFFKTTVRAVGDLSIDWGVPEGDPIFVIDDFAPGESEEKEVYIINNASTIRPVGVRGLETENLESLADKLLIKVTDGSGDLYGGTAGKKTLADFFDESGGPDGVPLFNLNGGTDKTITFKVTFNPDAGNEYQGKRVVFDLHIGIAINIPDACLGIKFRGDPIFGTEANDRIIGTNGNDLIYTFEGDDRINSSNGDDCVVAGPGNDKLNNSNGNDILYGGEGDDDLSGSNGHDVIFAGPGNDRLAGSNGNDQLWGEEGDDYLNGSNGNDTMSGGPGNDEIVGSNGNDRIYGGEGDDKLEGDNGSDKIYGDQGNDELFGGNNNDYLDGGEGIDTSNGGLGRDTCLTETKIKCEL